MYRIIGPSQLYDLDMYIRILFWVWVILKPQSYKDRKGKNLAIILSDTWIKKVKRINFRYQCHLKEEVP